MDFSGVRVLVLGDVMLDHYIAGSVQRISPEAPVPVARVEESWSVPGGAANVARNVSRLGCSVSLLGLLGEDTSATVLRRCLADEGVHDCLISGQGRCTTRKTRIMAQGQQLLRLDEEVSAPPTPEERKAMLAQAEELLGDCSVLVLSDYAKGVLTCPSGGQSLCTPLIALARSRGIPVLVDPKGSQWERYAGAHCVTPNSAEFHAECALPPETRLDRPQRAALAAELCSRYGFERLLITRGSRGMALFGKEAPCYLRAVAHEVADVSGAGDTALAVLAAAVGKGLGWEESARMANVAAGLAVGKLGTAPVNRRELAAALREQTVNPKLYTRDELRETLEDWRRKNLSVVFTNGCFDLVHPGHISLLRQAAAQGDRLVVGLNSDASVRRLKGSERPIQNEQSRALVLAAMQHVDAIVIFDEDTPLELIHVVCPQVLVKGSDYREDQVVGADFVKGHGGRVVLARLVEGCSTTSLARSIAKG